MRRLVTASGFLFVGSILVGCTFSGVAVAPTERANQLTDAERAAGWRLLFDGKTLTNWRGFRRDHVPHSWQVVDGTLRFTPKGERGDIMTLEQFDDFELKLEWKISPRGNSGIFFRVTEDHNRSWETGPEMQVLDNDGHPDGKNPRTSAGSNFGLHAPARDATRPVGSWNEVHMVVNGSHVEYWLNGAKVVEYELWTDEWRALVADTKFSEMPDYGLNKEGHIVLQDHGATVWYRNIKLRRL